MFYNNILYIYDAFLYFFQPYNAPIWQMLVRSLSLSLFPPVPSPLATQVKALSSQESPDPKAEEMIALAEQLKVSHAHAVENMENTIKWWL